MFIDVHQLHFRSTPVLQKESLPTIAFPNALHGLLGEANRPNTNPCAMRLRKSEIVPTHLFTLHFGTLGIKKPFRFQYLFVTVI